MGEGGACAVLGNVLVVNKCKNYRVRCLLGGLAEAVLLLLVLKHCELNSDARCPVDLRVLLF
ncbi:uncharacterized protein CANTADRAFT_26462 [Suhomyces tanzawaensis NRRL Y-17324]|uniref:Uncharacterized protein n=1 Tax=Suhomyces tanzawaensis NRRL Y-17324 TaxID=984487 RepID=A0A1E4SFM8_9ASCO|nr:uncharacterized protein CANTADRAFT_26462 [Suhomyces tanzawaensis NRRL Y-17324]ODV78311.1 hypothetical protein CANTADRAFT_26462 [Suhomyces tanzawaensis NRRL Y-17324]